MEILVFIDKFACNLNGRCELAAMFLISNFMFSDCESFSVSKIDNRTGNQRHVMTSPKQCDNCDSEI